MSDLGAVHRALNNLAAAESSFLEALKIYQQLGRQSGVSLQCGNLGDICAALARLGPGGSTGSRWA